MLLKKILNPTSKRVLNPILLPNNSFVSVWKTDNAGISNDNQVSLPFEALGIYNCNVQWGDDTSSDITVWDQAETTHTYASAGTYTITITGVVDGWRFNNAGDERKFLEIKNWGNILLGNSGQYFFDAANLIITATDTLDISNMTNFRGFFQDCDSLTDVPGMELWDVSSITTMQAMFSGCEVFNQNITNWDVSSVTTMRTMFGSCFVFNQDISIWDLSSCTDIAAMFSSAELFDQPVGIWNISNVNTMLFTFSNADAFDQNLGNLDIALVTTMLFMCNGSGFSQASYDPTLVAWATGSFQLGVSAHFGTAKYDAAGSPGTARSILVLNGWIITDGGPA